MEMLLGIVSIVLLILFYVNSRATKVKLQQLKERLEILEDEVQKLRNLSKRTPEEPVLEHAVIPPPIPAELLQPPSQPIDSKRPSSPINWERFMGVNLFAWLGGFVLFLAVAFFVKYSIDKNLISPQIRIVIGSIVGIGLMILGLRLQKRSFDVSAQTLCATGTVILYADIFPSYSFYHFIGFGTAFVLMSIITSAAFFLSVYLNARFVAILGLLGGFLTPLLLSHDLNNALALFFYIGFLDAGLIAVGLHRRWNFLVLCAAISTAIMQGVWANHFDVSEVFTAITICAAFEILFLAAYLLFQRRSQATSSIVAGALLPPIVSFAFTIFFLGEPQLAARPFLVFGHLLIADLCLIAISLSRKGVDWIHQAAGIVVFLFLASWTSAYLTRFLLFDALFLFSGFAILHTALPILLRHYQARTSGREAEPTTRLADFQLQLSAILPFLLLTLVVITVALINPSPVFAVAFLLIIVMLFLSQVTQFHRLVAVAFAGVLFLQYSWQTVRFHPPNAWISFAWYLMFYAVFSIYPFLFYREFEKKMLPWRIAALSGPLHFYLVYHAVFVLHGTSFIGLLPVAFCVPPLLGFLQRLRSVPFESPLRNANLAWFAGAFLFFITLIFPVQFDREWITIGWAMEGVALLWLFHKIPHAGLRFLGVALLLVSFFRLTINPEVLSYHTRSNAPIFNWYLYTYGNVIAALLIGGKLLKTPRNKIRNTNVQALLYALSAILAFVLLNIEIADYFAKGAVLTFQFSGNFARDMSYSIGWAAYALILLIVGIRKKITAARYASIALLSITLLKVFIHDLASLNQLYRVGALVGVAMMLILASYLYQRFVSFEPKGT